MSSRDTDGPAAPTPDGAALRQELEDARRELALLQGELDRAIRARDETLSTVSHDLKNPMSALLLGIQRLARFADEGRRQQAEALTEKLERTLRGMSRLVEVLVDLARLDAGRLRLDRRPEALSALAARALEPLRALAADKAQRLDLAVEPGLPELACDAERLVHAISSLVGNALKFSPVGGTVRVSIQRQDRELVCSVADGGPGVSPELLPHLFERQAQPPDGAPRGQGLGLRAVKGYVEAHGGRVWVRSEPGHGATFSFALPVG